jgi:hypothetical protein
MIRTLKLAGVIASFFCSATIAQNYGDDVYQPSPGQPGKDVVWVPTPDTLVTKMLTAAKVTKDDLVYDPRRRRQDYCRAKDFGARSIGIEYDKGHGGLARRNVRRAGLDDKVTIITGDIFEENFSNATVVTLYLLPALNVRLRPIILKMKPGTRVVSHAFNMADWDPDERLNAESRDAFLWYVPANVEGTWSFQEEGTGPWQATPPCSASSASARFGGILSLLG